MNATFKELMNTQNLDRAIQRNIIQSFGRKTWQEQQEIFIIKKKIFANITTESHKEAELLKQMRTYDNIAKYDYSVLLLAIQLYNANQSKSQYVAIVREARQDINSIKIPPLRRAIEALIPLVIELKNTGASFESIAKTITQKQKKILSNRTVTADYLKKTYYRYMKEHK